MGKASHGGGPQKRKMIGAQGLNIQVTRFDNSERNGKRNEKNTDDEAIDRKRWRIDEKSIAKKHDEKTAEENGRTALKTMKITQNEKVKAQAKKAGKSNNREQKLNIGKVPFIDLKAHDDHKSFERADNKSYRKLNDKQRSHETKPI